MLSGRGDIIGDLARLRRDFVGAANQTEDLLVRLEVLAAAAVELGMSTTIVGKASGVPPERIAAVLDAQPAGVRRCASDYERRDSGVVTRRAPDATSDREAPGGRDRGQGARGDAHGPGG